MNSLVKSLLSHRHWWVETARDEYGTPVRFKCRCGKTKSVQANVHLKTCAMLEWVSKQKKKLNDHIERRSTKKGVL